MADNVILDLMSGGSTVATDNIAGVQHQLIKVEYGADGAATQVDATNPFPTSVINGTVAVNTHGTIDSGTVSVNTPGTITSGTVSINAGTIGAGTINTMGTLTNLVHGTIENSGTTTGIGTVSGVAVVSALTSGTVSVNTPGTITSGTIAINAGTVGGKAASGAAAVANPVQIAGTDSGGSIYSPLITTAGAIGSVVNIGTIKEAGTVTGVGTLPGVGVVSNLTNGSIKITAGTTNAGTLDLVTTVTTVSNLTNGSIKVTAGTEVVTSGSIAVTAGTVNSGTINAGTINSGTINAGTINTGTINSGTINVGTLSPVPSKMISVVGSIWGTTSGTAGTLVAAPTSGSAIYLNHVAIINEGTTTLTAGMGFGTGQQGTTVVARAAMGGNGGLVVPFPNTVTGGGTQAPLVMWTTGSGTASFTASYFVAL